MKKFLFALATVTVSIVNATIVNTSEELKNTTDCCNDTITAVELNPTDDISMDIFGIWQSIDNEFVQISRDMDYKITFMRVARSKELQAKGFITAGNATTLSIDRVYPENQTYDLEYVFSPSRKTLVIMKPNSDEAWVFHKIQ